MEKENLCVATITLARTPEEEATLQSSLQVLAALHIQTFICDGGSSASFTNFIKSIPHFTLLPETIKGVQAQAIASLTKASLSNTSFILYTEPDKEDFFSNRLAGMIAHVQPTADMGIYVAARSSKGFATFPPFQQMTETTINRCCAELTGRPSDYCYGPFLLSKQLIPYLGMIQEDVGWGWRPFVFNMAHRLGYRIEIYERDFSCPEKQRQDNQAERIYRMKQLEQNIRGLVLSASDVLNEVL